MSNVPLPLLEPIARERGPVIVPLLPADQRNRESCREQNGECDNKQQRTTTTKHGTHGTLPSDDRRSYRRVSTMRRITLVR